jgi:hypothetical protein
MRAGLYLARPGDQHEWQVVSDFDRTNPHHLWRFGNHTRPFPDERSLASVVRFDHGGRRYGGANLDAPQHYHL